MEDVLRDALSEDNAIRRTAEQRLSYGKLRRGYSVALARRLAKNAPPSGSVVGDVSTSSADHMFMPKRLLAGMLLQQFVQDHWAARGRLTIPPEDKAQVRHLVVAAMMDDSAPRAARASAARSVALMAVGGEWPEGWGGLVPQLLCQVGVAAMASSGGGRNGGGGAAGDGAGRGQAESAIARAESCIKCLQYMAEEVPMEHVPELFQQAFPGLLKAGEVYGLPRKIRAKVFRIVRELFESIGTLVTVGGETAFLPWLQQWVPSWLHLVSKTLQLAVEANTNADEDRETPGAEEEKGPAVAPVVGIWEGGVARNGAVSSRNGGGFRGKEFSVELEALRTGMVLLTRVPSAVGDGHLGQLLPPLWGLLTEGLPEHERFVMADSGGGEGENDGAEKGYASDGEGQGFEDLIEEALGLLAAIAACPERQVSALLGGEGAGLGLLLAVVIRYLQLTEQSATLWEEAPNEFLEQDEGEEEEGKGVTAGGARSAGLSLIRELCDAFPEKTVPALIDEAKAALANPVGLQGVSREEITGVGETPEAPEAVAAAAAAAKGRQWRLREAILLSLGAGSKAIIRQVNRRCPLAAKVKHSSGGRGHPRSGGCKGKKNKGGSTYSPGILCAGARGLGLDLGGFQAVALAAAEGRDPGAPNSSLVQARGLWLSARFAPLLSAEGVCKAAEACATALQPKRPPQPDRPLGLRLYACRALGMLSRHSARMVRRDQGSKGIAGRSICGPRIGSAARSAVDYASGLAASCEETTAHLVPETMIQLVKGYPLQVTQKGGGLLLIHLAMSMWEQYPCDPAVVEVVEDLLLAMTRIPQVVPQMIETVVPFLPEVFEQVRAGKEDLQAVAQGSLSLLRQLIRRVGRPRSSVADAPARRALLEALRGACPLLLTTDSHVLLQDGCKTLRTFVSALGADIASSSPSPPPPPQQQQQIPPSPPPTSGPTPRSPLYPPPPPPPSMTPPSTLPITPPPLPPSRSPSPRTTPGGRGIIAGGVKDVTASVSISINWHGPLSSPPPPRGVIVVRGGGSGYRGDNTEVAGGVAGGGFVGDDRGLDIEGEGVIGGGGRGGACPEGWASGSCPHALTQCDDSTLSMVLAFLYRVMARGVHEASAMCTGGLVSALLRHIPLSYLGEETVHDLLSKTFDKLQRSSCSLLTDELLRVFIGFVNHETYGASTLVDVLVRIARTDAHAERPCHRPDDAEAETDDCLSGNIDGNTISSRRRRSGSQGGSDGVDGSDEALAEAADGRGQGSEERDRGGGDELASFRRLMGLWLYFHENAQNSNQTKRSALGLTRLLNAASHGDPRLCCLRVSTDDMYSKGEIGGASGERGQGMRRKYLAPSLRAMEGQLLPVCLLMSIIRTARDFGGKDEEPGGRKDDHVNRSEEDADVMGDAFGDHGGLRASNAGESSDSEESSDAQGSDDDDQDGTGSDDGRVRKRDGQCFKPKRFNVRSDVLGLAALADLDDDERRTSAASVSTPASPKISVTAVAGGNSTTSNAKVTSSSSTGCGNVDNANAAIGNGVVAADDRLDHGGDGMATGVMKVTLPPSAPVTYRVSSAPACGYYPSSVSFPGPVSSSGPKRTTAMTMGQPWSVAAARDDDAAADVVPPSEGGGTSNARRHNRPQASIHHRTFSDTNVLAGSAAGSAMSPVRYGNGGVRLVGGVLSQSSSCGEEGTRGRGGEGFARVSARRWNSDGVSTGLVRFLKAASGKSEERLRAWAGMLPDEEQAALTALLQAA